MTRTGTHHQCTLVNDGDEGRDDEELRHGDTVVIAISMVTARDLVRS